MSKRHANNTDINNTDIIKIESILSYQKNKDRIRLYFLSSLSFLRKDNFFLHKFPGTRVYAIHSSYPF